MENSDRVALQVVNFDDLVAKIAKFETFNVAGRLYPADLLVPQLTINATEIVSEASVVPAQVLTWGIEAARARRFRAHVDAAYRQWRDRRWLELKSDVSEGGKSPSDATAEKMLHSQPEYPEWRRRLDDSQEAAECAEAVYEAFRIKGRMVEAAEKALRDEAGGPYYVAEQPPQTPVRTPR